MTQPTKNKTEDFFENQIKIAVKKMRSPEGIGENPDIGYRYANRTFEIFEIRPARADKPIPPTTQALPAGHL